MRYHTIPGVYKIVDKKTQLCYVGSSYHVTQRHQQHFCNLKNGSHVCRPLQEMYNRHGLSNFTFVVLQVVWNIDLLSGCELQWMDMHAVSMVNRYSGRPSGDNKFMYDVSFSRYVLEVLKKRTPDELKIMLNKDAWIVDTCDLFMTTLEYRRYKHYYRTHLQTLGN